MFHELTDFYELDSEALTSDIPDNQLTSGIQSKSVQGLGPEPSVGVWEA